MRRIFTITILLTFYLIGFSQTQTIDSLKEVLDTQAGKLNALDERVLVNETDLGKLNKIKVSGYVQAQYEVYQRDILTTSGAYSSFFIRRARIKFTYEAADGIKFVLQPDFSTGNLSLKDAYAVVNLPKLKELTLWAGQFNRPNYEVEYSSSQREVFERSRVIRAIYPGEREVGVKLEYNGSTFPLKAQFAVLNGNFTGKEPIDVDTKKDLMGRVVYSLKLPGAGLGIDLGANGYYGGSQIKANKYISVNPTMVDSVNIGDYLDKKWLGGEIQIFADILGGLAIKGEYMAGTNNYASLVGAKALIAEKKADPNKIRDFSGYYIYMIKNIGAKNQLVARYDYYDPNRKLSGDDAMSELAYGTWTLAWQYYLNDFIRISLQYVMPRNETNSTTPADRKDDVLGIRVQAKF